MKKQVLKIKKILIMILCIIVSLLSTVSCTKDELSFDQNNQTDNLTDVQAKIGKIKGNYEAFENIESYKDFQFEPNKLFYKQSKALEKIKTYQEFPNQRKSLDVLAKEYGLTSLRYYHYLFEIYKLGEHMIMTENLESKKKYTDHFPSYLINHYDKL